MDDKHKDGQDDDELAPGVLQEQKEDVRHAHCLSTVTDAQKLRIQQYRNGLLLSKAHHAYQSLDRYTQKVAPHAVENSPLFRAGCIIVFLLFPCRGCN